MGGFCVFGVLGGGGRASPSLSLFHIFFIVVTDHSPFSLPRRVHPTQAKKAKAQRKKEGEKKAKALEQAFKKKQEQLRKEQQKVRQSKKVRFFRQLHHSISVCMREIEIEREGLIRGREGVWCGGPNPLNMARSHNTLNKYQ